MNAAQRAELRKPEFQIIVDKCIADIMIEGVPRWRALRDGAVRATCTKDEFEQLVLARVEKLLKL